MNRLLVLSVMVWSVTGCTPMKSVLVMARSTDDFVPLHAFPSVRYEPGMERLAGDIAAEVPSAVALRAGIDS